MSPLFAAPSHASALASSTATRRQRPAQIPLPTCASCSTKRFTSQASSRELPPPPQRHVATRDSLVGRTVPPCLSKLLTLEFAVEAMTPTFRAVSILVGSLALAAILAWSVTTIAVNSGSLAKPRPVLLLTGDSLTEQGTDPTKSGWATLLQSRYTRTSDVVTRGLSGYNTKWFLKDALPLIEAEIQTDAYKSPSLITVWLGANDAALWNGSDSVAHVPIEDYKENLIKIVRGLWVAAPTAKMLLVTPPPVDDAARAEVAAETNDSLLDRSNAVTTTYAHACVETGEVLGVPVLDLNSFLNAMNETIRNGLFDNGLHFNSEGNKVVDAQIRVKLAAEFPALDEALQSWQLPASSKWEAEDPWVAAES